MQQRLGQFLDFGLRHFYWGWGAVVLAFWAWLAADALGKKHLPVWLTQWLGAALLAAQILLLVTLRSKVSARGGFAALPVRARNTWLALAAMPFIVACGVAWSFLWYAKQTSGGDIPPHIYWGSFIFGAITPLALLLGIRWLRDELHWPQWSSWALASVALLPLWQLLLHAMEGGGPSPLRATVGWGGGLVIFLVGMLWTIWIVDMRTRLREEQQRGIVAALGDAPSSRSFAVTFTLALCLGFAGADRFYVRRWILAALKCLAGVGSVFAAREIPAPWGGVLIGIGVSWWLADLFLLTAGKYVGENGRRVLSQSWKREQRSAISPLAAMDHSSIPADKHAASPFDLNAWYYGAHNQKLKQSFGALSTYSLLFLGILMALSNLTGCQQIYELPAGGGKAQMPQKVQVIKQIIRKKFVVNPFSSILFNPPPIEQVKLRLEQLTQHVYKAGQGEGQNAGFAGGTGQGMVRFIRLRYADGDWDQDLDLNSDLNMLIWYAANTGHKTAPKPEVMSIAQLRSFPVGKSPPLVYITGQRNLPLTPLEIETLRDYLLEKRGMLFADNGGSSGWHSQFFSMMHQVLQRVEPRPVPLDHPIHAGLGSIPIVAPHGGSTAYGWMVDGRLVAYYHPGDIGDAWADGHAGVNLGIWEASYRLGGNVMLYAHAEYSKWLQAQRKK